MTCHLAVCIGLVATTLTPKLHHIMSNTHVASGLLMICSHLTRGPMLEMLAITCNVDFNMLFFFVFCFLFIFYCRQHIITRILEKFNLIQFWSKMPYLDT